MKTLAELKRDAKAGKLSLELTERYGGTDFPERMAGKRKVVGCNTVALKLLNHDGKESEMRFGYASLIEYTAETLTVYNAGFRELNDEERRELNRAIEERKRYQMENPYSDSFWHMKRFWSESKYPYLYDCGEMKQGKRLQHTKDGDIIVDSAIKGDAILKYKVYME